MIHFRCPRCGVRLKGREGSAGRKRTCPSCGGKIVVPPEALEPTPEVWNPDGAVPALAKARTKLSDSTRPETSGSSLGVPTTPEISSEDCSFLGPPSNEGDIGSLGTFRIQEILGSGATGIVFRAEDTQLRRLVALKVLRPAIAASAHSRQRFLREARAAAALDHENILTIYHVGEDRGIPWLAMKFLRGESLKDRVNRASLCLPATDVIRIGAEVADALSAAHAGGLVHRDVKPSNILLEEGTDRAKLIDFGLVMVENDGGQLTRMGCVVGTPAYMAPEQADGATVDHRSDLYSLGCVLYRASTGRVPFEGQNPIQVFLAQRTQTPAHPRELVPDLPPGLADLVMNLLAKDPAERPGSAQAVRDTLRALHPESCTITSERQETLAAARPVAEPPTSTSASTTENPWADVLIDSSESLVVTGDGPSSTTLRRRGKEKRVRWLWIALVASAAVLLSLLAVALLRGR
jgi:serine/threonine protein kinase